MWITILRAHPAGQHGAHPQAEGEIVAGKEGRSKRWWFDPRFAIGVGLIVVSIAGTAFVVAAADSSVEVMSARAVLTPGQVVTADDFLVARIGFEGAGDLYLQADDVPQGGLVVTRTVSSGELVPMSAVGSTAGLDETTVVIALTGRLAESIGPGSTADVWAATADENGGFAAPVVIVPDATVVRIVKPDGLVVDESSGSVEVLVPQDTVARLLEAAANDDALSLVPATLPAGN